MTNEEFKQFTRALFTQLPGLPQWVKDNSPDPQGTLDSWKRTLSCCTFQECLCVLADWESGTKKPPQAYEREVVAVVIRQSVMLDRDRQRAVDKRSQSQQQLSAEARRRAYRPAALGIPSVAEAYKNGRELRQRYLDGKINEQEYEAELQQLLEKA